MYPSYDELKSTARVVSLPLITRFRGIDVREALLLEGPEGWTEFSPFAEYDDTESAVWLKAALDFGWAPLPEPVHASIRVNATMPAVSPDRIAGVLARFPGCRTVKVKVADGEQVLADDVARVAAVRQLLGPDGRIRVDANGGWNVDEAERAVHALAPFDLEYIEQPCSTIEELAELHTRIKHLDIPIAADESVRRALDPLEIARSGAVDLLVIKAQPLGGVSATLRLIEEAGLPVIVSSALDTSVGISMGLALAARIPTLEFDCGLGTAALLAADVTEKPLLPINGRLEPRRVIPSDRLLAEYAASPERTTWWLNRLERCYALV
jgi:O-succinylbenzoate synthase